MDYSQGNEMNVWPKYDYQNGTVLQLDSYSITLRHCLNIAF